MMVADGNRPMHQTDSNGNCFAQFVEDSADFVFAGAGLGSPKPSSRAALRTDAVSSLLQPPSIALSCCDSVTIQSFQQGNDHAAACAQGLAQLAHGRRTVLAQELADDFRGTLK